MEIRDARQFVDSLSKFGMRFGLDRMHRVLNALGNPERRFRVLHVAGTNGKGSTCAFAATMFQCSGRRVGLYTSPHLVRPNERIRVDGVEIPDAAFAEGVETILRVFPSAQSGEDPLTYFEFGTALALWHFAREKVDIAVLETGLGGRLDATNAVAPAVTAITRIGLDHTALLGGTLAAIAGEKAGIFKPDARIVLARQPAEALGVLEACANAIGQPPLVAGRDFALEGDGPYRFVGVGSAVDGLALALPGTYQRENAETAIACARLMVPDLSDDVIRAGLRQTRWPGRMETVGADPLTIMDGAHNPDGARALSEAMRSLYPGARVHLVFGALADKDVRGIARLLLPLASRLYLARPKDDRGLDVAALKALVGELGVDGNAYGSVVEAIRAAQAAARRDGAGALVLIAGSLYVVGEARAHLLP